MSNNNSNPSGGSAATGKSTTHLQAVAVVELVLAAEDILLGAGRMEDLPSGTMDLLVIGSELKRLQAAINQAKQVFNLNPASAAEQMGTLNQ